MDSLDSLIELTLAEYSDFNCDKNKYPYHEYDLTYIAKAGCSEKSMIRYIFPVQGGEGIQQLCNNIFNITIKQI